MAKLPDFEALAIFAKVVELRSFAAAATELALSKATVSKAVSRLEQRLGARLFNRTSRRLALTDAGQKLAERATQLLVDGEAAENEALSQSTAPRGLVRLAVPMTFGIKAVAPLLPEFLEQYPEVSIDLHLSDATVDLIGEGFDAGLRIARLPDSSLIARRLCAMPRYTVAAPSYLKRHGRPTHPMHLAQHKCFGYAYLSTPGVWHYTNASGEQASVRPAGQLRVNNGEAVLPSVIAGLGIADLPDFIVGDAIASGEVEVILKGWKQPEGAVHLVTPPGGPRPARVEVLAEFLMKHFAKGKKRQRRAAGNRSAHTQDAASCRYHSGLSIRSSLHSMPFPHDRFSGVFMVGLATLFLPSALLIRRSTNGPAATAAKANPQPKSRPTEAVADGSRRTASVCPLLGDQFGVRKIGMTVFGNELKSIKSSWGLDDPRRAPASGSRPGNSRTQDRLDKRFSKVTSELECSEPRQQGAGYC